MKDHKPPFMPGQPIHSRRGPGLGCFAGGCGIVLLGLVLMCVGSYYVTMHTSFPLAMLKYGIESDGNVRIDGLRGSIANGFEIDRLEFQSEEYRDRWNELRNVKFRFNGIYDLAYNKRLIIEEVSVSGGTIYAEIDEQGQFDIDPDIDGEEIAEEFSDEIEDIKREFEDEDLDELREVRIELVSISDIQIVNPDSDIKAEFETIEFKNFEWRNGEIRRLGDLTVVSDQIVLDTAPSTVFGDAEVAWNFKGTVKSPVHQALVADMPFDVDFAIVDRETFRSRFDLFEGQVKLDDPYGDRRTIELNEFSPADYFDMGKLSASHWNLVAKINPPTADGDDSAVEEEQAKSSSRRRKKRRKREKPVRELTVEPGGRFHLGDTTFEIQPTSVLLNSPEQSGQPVIHATAERDGQAIKASLEVLGKAPYVAIQLTSDNDPPRELWAKLFFQQAYDELSAEQRSQVDATLAEKGSASSDSDEASE